MLVDEHKGADPLNGAIRYIRIVATPPSEAPLWLRGRWVGRELPLADGGRGPWGAYTSGALSGPSNLFVRSFGDCSGSFGYNPDMRPT